MTPNPVDVAFVADDLIRELQPLLWLMLGMGVLAGIILRELLDHLAGLVETLAERRGKDGRC